MRVAHAPGMPRMFSPPQRVSDPNIHHGMCVTHLPWCMPGSLTIGFLWSRWRGKRSRHSPRMHNPQFCVSVKRPMTIRLPGKHQDEIHNTVRIQGLKFIFLQILEIHPAPETPFPAPEPQPPTTTTTTFVCSRDTGVSYTWKNTYKEVSTSEQTITHSWYPVSYV